MKYALIVIASAFFATTALADDGTRFCASNGEMAAVVAQARDAGLPISDVMTMAIANFPRGDARELVMTVVAAVYASDWTPYEAFAIIEEVCLQGLGEQL